MVEAPWFEIDRKGLKKVLARKGKEFVTYELIQNSWDENTTKVNVSLKRIPNTRKAELIVEDDNPEGFADLSHAFTLFAESKKKGDVQKRGRFNLGEKLVLALCETAEISSTTGTVRFTESGRSRSKSKTASGSVFKGVLHMTDAEIKRCEEAVRQLLPPHGIQTFFNGVLIPSRPILSSLTAALATEIADEEGQLRPTTRKTTVEIYDTLPGETATLYEMGIPVVATEDRWHINVQQKVPLNVDRDNVSPSYLAYVRAHVVEHMQSDLTQEDANAPWVKEAINRYGDELSNDTVNRIADLRFGEKRVSYDPSDPEANKLAVSQGYMVVHGASLSKPEWNTIRRAGAILPAGQVTPSPKPYGPNGRPLTDVPKSEWTPNMRAVVAYAVNIARELMGVEIEVRVVNDSWWGFNATYGTSRVLTLNVGALGARWFDGPLENINDLLIHEFGHQYSGDHLSHKYYDALTALGGRLCTLAFAKREIFNPVLHLISGNTLSLSISIPDLEIGDTPCYP
jgi:hypothetical protein